MDVEKLAKVGVDYKEGLNRFSNNEALYLKYLKLFINDKTFENLTDAIVCKDYKKAFYHAHTFKGMVGNLSMKTLFKESSELVELLRANETDNLELYVEKVRMAYDIVLEVLNEIF